MQITLVENCQDHIHDEHGQEHQDGEAGYGVAKRKRLALQPAAHSRRKDLLGRILYKLRRLADRVPWLQVEEQSDACELIDMVHRLRVHHASAEYAYRRST